MDGGGEASEADAEYERGGHSVSRMDGRTSLDDQGRGRSWHWAAGAGSALVLGGGGGSLFLTRPDLAVRLDLGPGQANGR